MAAATIPIVDFAAFDSGSNKARKVIAQQIDQAFQDLGFVILQNHGLSSTDVKQAFQRSKQFFALPTDVKQLAPHPPGHTHHRGWSGVGREKVSQHVYDKDELKHLRHVQEIKETFESGNTTDDMQPNIWLSEHHLPGFRAYIEVFFQKCADLIEQVLKALAISLNSDDETILSNNHSRQLYQLRLAYYPSVAASVLRTGVQDRCAAHSDFGTLTLLFQDANSGLEVEDPQRPGNFFPVPSIANTVIVNCGDLLERWSNGRWRSGVHRVVAPPVDRARTDDAGEEILRSRFSIPFFAAPNPDALIEPLPGCWNDADKPRKYGPITVHDYVMMRMEAIR